MKSLPQSRLLRICFVGLLAVVVLLPFHAFLSTWGGTAIGPLLVWKSWKEIVLASLSLVFLIWLLRVPSRAKLFFADRFVAIAGIYVVFVLLSALLHLGLVDTEAMLAGVIMDVRYVVAAVLVYGVFRFGDLDYGVWRRYAVGFLVSAGTLLAVIGLLQVTVIPKDFLEIFGYDKNVTIAPYTLIDDNPDALRGFATLRGPNDFGAFLIVPLLAALSVARTRRWFLVPAGVILLGIVASSSRSAWLATLIAIAAFAILTFGKKAFRSKKVIAGLAAGFGIGLLLAIAAVTVPVLRLAIFHSSPTDSSLTEGSTDAHWNATASGVGRVINNPAGCGAGCAGPASFYGDEPFISENYYVQIAEELGIGGLLIWGILFVLIMKRLYTARADWFARILFAGGIGISAIGLWLHVWSDDPLSITWWVLVGMVLGVLSRTYSSKADKNLVS